MRLARMVVSRAVKYKNRGSIPTPCLLFFQVSAHRFCAYFIRGCIMLPPAPVVGFNTGQIQGLQEMIPMVNTQESTTLDKSRVFLTLLLFFFLFIYFIY